MNKLDKQYTDLLQDILDNGINKQDRTGTGTISVFGRQIRHDMKDGFPLLTTKRMPFKTIVIELLWFLRGDTNIKYLVDNGCNIWNGDAYKRYHTTWAMDTYGVLAPLSQEQFVEKIKTNDQFANEWGELGPIYGKQWRKWEVNEPKEVLRTEGVTWPYEPNPHTYQQRVGTFKIKQTDQIQNLINDLKTNPDSRRLMVNAWNVGELDQMVLPPCHYGFQVYTRELSFDEFWDRLTPKQRGTMEKPYEGETYNGIDSRIEFKNIVSEVHNLPTRAISLMWNQRSVDTFLGLPFNIASYGLLLEILAKEVNMVPDQLIGNLGDVHLYSNHIEPAKEQIGRELTYSERRAYRAKLVREDKILFNGEVLEDDFADLDKHNIPKRTRTPLPLPVVKLSSGHNLRAALKGNFDEIDLNDILLINYQSHPTIKAPLSN